MYSVGVMKSTSHTVADRKQEHPTTPVIRGKLSVTGDSLRERAGGVMEGKMSTLDTKLNPTRFDGISGKMAALVGLLLGQEVTEPSLAEATTTSDGFVLARASGDCGFNEWIGTVSDLRQNFRRLFDVAGLTDAEREQANKQFGYVFGVRL